MKERLLGPEADSDPYPVYARLRQEDPVHRVRLRDDLYCWVVTRYSDAKAALADPRLSRDPRVAVDEWRQADRGRPLEDEANLGVHLLTREAPEHTRLRRLVALDFGARRAEGLRPRVREVAEALVDGFAAQGTAELIGEFAYPLAITIVCEILGIPAEDHAIFRQWTSNAVHPGPDGVPGPGDHVPALIATKRSAPGHDLISRLIEATGSDRLSQVELESMIFLLLLAGHEGSVALIGNGVLALLGDPDQRALLGRRPELAGSTVEEILRYDGPMEMAAWRFATEPVELGGALIGPGEPVAIALAGAHRDPGQFAEPDRLDIERTHNSHLGFGYGAHYCIGAPLGRVEGAVALETIFRRLPDIELAVPVSDLRRQQSLVIRGLRELPVVFGPAHPRP